jgi:hypothetical protein
MCRAENAGRLLSELIALSEAQNSLLAADADITGLLAGEDKLREQLAAELAGLADVPGEVPGALRRYLAVKEAGIKLVQEKKQLTSDLLTEVEQAQIKVEKIAAGRIPARFIDKKG